MTPREFAIGQLKLVRDRWTGVRDADRECIHDARVALRRVRATLDVIDEPGSDAMKLCRQLGRALGRVRELDVTDSYLEDVGNRVPSADCAVATVRRELGDDRHREARRLVKVLDEVRLRPLARLRRPPAALAFWKNWRTDLFDAVGARSADLRAAVDDAPAVYMPNRLHRVRIALKKFRYTLEVVQATTVPIPSPLMRQLRKTQDALGRLHDQHVAHQVVRRFEGEGRRLGTELRVLDAVIEADRAAEYAKYLTRRGRLRAFGEYGAALSASQRPRAARMALRALPAAGLLAAPIALWRLGEARASRDKSFV